MNESLVPRQNVLPEAREEALTRQFYEWETRGRGWNLRPFPVELEPPLRPLYLFDPGFATAPIDDGRSSTFFSRLFEKKRTQTQRESEWATEDEAREWIAEQDEPVACDYYEEEFYELQIILPNDQKITKSVCEQLLSSLTYCSNPISFEVIGTAEAVTVQMAATHRDLIQLHLQIKAYLPSVLIRETDSFLEIQWENCEANGTIVDFGLSNEFMIPLSTIPNLESDPLVSIVAAMCDLRDDEVAVFQILFQKARGDWSTEILRAIRASDGTPFFSNAPELVPSAKQKLSSALFAAVVRVAAKTWSNERSWQFIRGIASGLSQLSGQGNELIPLSNDGYRHDNHENALIRRLSFRCGMILNLNELVSLVHPPSTAVRSEKLLRADDKTKAAPGMAQGRGLILGENVYQGKSNVVALTDDQRTRHTHLIGSSGSGKSTMMLSMINQDMVNGHGLCVIDPHGDLIDSIIDNVPDDRLNDVVLIDPADAEYPIGFNILQANSALEKTILASDLTATFRRMSTSWGDVMDSVLANAILALIESSRGGTLFDLKRFLVEKDFREEFLTTVADDAFHYFWTNEFHLIAGKPQSSILIRLDAFLRQSLIRNIVCQKQNRLDFRSIMDKRKILLVKLSQGLIGEENAYLLGTMLVSRLYQSALSRQDTKDRPYFWLYMDEFQHFITPSMERILSGSRKYNLGLILAHQEFRQLQTRSQEVASSVLSNCYSRICFRLGDTDSEKFAGGFSFFDSKSLQNLGVGEAIARVERADFDFNLKVNALAPVGAERAARRFQAVVSNTRSLYGRLRSEVEAELKLTRPLTVKVRSRDISESPPKAEAQAPIPRSAKSEVVTDQRSEHRYLQNIVKRIGESFGYVSTIEKDVFGGVGRVDIALENNSIRVACEIAVKNTTRYETQNIQKCLGAGFDRVVIISPDPRHLSSIQKQAKQVLTPEQQGLLYFIELENFHLFLSSLDRLDLIKANNEKKVRGYMVKNIFKEISAAESGSRKKVILDIISTALRRKKHKQENEQQ